MKALAIDSAAKTLTVAAKNEDLRASVSLEAGSRQSEKLPGAIIYVLEQAELAPESLAYAALHKGPGAFTALRIAFAALKAVRLAHQCPLYAVPTLEAFAFPFAFWPGAVVPALDAKRLRFYAAVYRRGAECSPAGDWPPEEIRVLLDPEERVLTVGPDAALLRDTLRGLQPGMDVSAYTTLNAVEGLFALAERKISAGEKPLGDWEGPEYIRLP
ncbi:MAG: tRNA (adenosine(37)-N6)-threonylcarbamoyltransferase complex dimerization subunit type 1 TsaB [Treponema sp.]|jgi:tRNA threonylcarbamoyladenosine biosynthesis protein TsaB|nr:tRNA (adenosine(37)-N6)-threonylcarbamoyltransferase complex dimerization subunit type 1 TsaB [Treponema sp.]